jgi:hypothetical protein
MFAFIVGAGVGCGSSTEPASPVDSGNSRFPLLTNAGGHVLSPLRLVVVVAANDSLRDSLFAFAKSLPSSQWWRTVAAPYGVSSSATSATVLGPPIAPGTQLAFGDLLSYVQQVVIDSAGYRADGHTVYLVYLPPGVTCTGSTSCNLYPSFHVPFGASDALAVVERVQGGSLSMMEAMTTSASHETIEAVTDPMFDAWKLTSPFLPWNGSAWGLDDGGNFEENADMCEGTRYLESGFYYQRIFANQAAVLGGDPCIPAISTPYYNVTTDKGWYSTTTGAVTVPITGWSVGAVSDWIIGIESGPRAASLAAPSYSSLTCPDTLTIGTARYCGLNSGKTATVHVTLPPGASSKSYFTVRVVSLRFGPNGERPPYGEDYAHRWIFGVYVP